MRGVTGGVRSSISGENGRFIIVRMPGSYVKVVLYKGTHRLEVIGRIKRLSPEFGVMLEDVISVKDGGMHTGVQLNVQRYFNSAKTIFEGRWITDFITMRPVPDEVVLGIKM